MKTLILISIFFSKLLMAEVLTSRAYSLQNKLIYKEKLTIKRLENGRVSYIKTEYRDESEKLFATLESDFEKSFYIPDSKFSDARFGLIEIVTFYPEKRIIEVNRSMGNKLKNGTINIDSSIVMGQGFNNFIYDNFNSLMKEDLIVWFGIAPRIDKFRFRISFLNDKSNQRKVVFKIEPESFVLKAFVSPIVLTYDRETKKLLEFQGLSNIDDFKGNSQEVIIRYDY